VCGNVCSGVRTTRRSGSSGDPVRHSVRTYAWYPGQGDIVGVYGDRARLASDVMRESIDEGLARHGFRPANVGDADVLVLYGGVWHGHIRGHGHQVTSGVGATDCRASWLPTHER
jgi:hypothetical protein